MVDAITAIVKELGFPSNEALFALLIMVLLVVGAIVVVVITKYLLDIYPYAYSNAKTRARKGRLFDDKQLSEILETENVTEIKNYLSGFEEYAKFINKYPIEKALNCQLAESYAVLADLAPSELEGTFKALNTKWDIYNIKSLITATHIGLSSEETLDLLVPFGKEYETIESLTDSNEMTDIIAGLEGTIYASILEDALPDYKEKNLVLPLEAALDKFYLEELLRNSATPDNDNNRILHIYIGTQVDVDNLKIILRSKADGLSFSDINPYITETGFQIQDWKLKELMESEDVPTVVNALEGTEYSEALNEALTLYEQSGSIVVFEDALNELLKDNARRLSLKQPFGVGPMIGFLDGKKREISNLKTIVRSKREVGISSSAVKEMLV